MKERRGYRRIGRVVLRRIAKGRRSMIKIRGEG
jgi:hypothetical protein